MPRRDVVVLHLAGEIDLAAAPELADRLRAAFRFGAQVIVNLEQVDFMDCAGLRVLLDAAAAPETGIGRMSVTPGPAAVRRLFALTDAARALRVLPGPVLQPAA